MQSTLVNLPTTTGAAAATLLFERDYAQGNHWLDFLHLIRQWPVYLAIQDPDALEEDYWCNLNDFRTTFTTKCAEMLGGVDVIVDTPSTRGYHRFRSVWLGLLEPLFIAAVKPSFSESFCRG